VVSSFVAAATQTPLHRRVLRRFENQVTGRQFSQVLALMAGLAMAELELAASPPGAEDLLGRAFDELSAILDAHPCETPDLADVFLIGNDQSADVRACLLVQARWYASRTRLETLLPHADRRSTSAPRFSPFVAYLRFHTGDALFLGILIRCLLRLERLRREDRSGDAFKTAFDRVRERWRADRKLRAEWLRQKAALLRYERVWRTEARTATAWRHVGLIARLVAAAPPPQWLPAAPDSSPLAEFGRIAVQVAETIVSHGLSDSVDFALEGTPISGVLTWPGIDPDTSEMLARAHTFAALASAYADAWSASDS
jgi:hypothetical protein